MTINLSVGFVYEEMTYKKKFLLPALCHEVQTGTYLGNYYKEFETIFSKMIDTDALWTYRLI